LSSGRQTSNQLPESFTNRNAADPVLGSDRILPGLGTLRYFSWNNLAA
jgi:hypothetical protein